MDTLLCDDILQEIFHRVPPPSSAAVSLVSRRCLRLLRSSTAALSLHLAPPCDPIAATSFSSFLGDHKFLSSLYISAAGEEQPILLAVASSCPNLRRLRFLSSPVSTSSLCTLSASCTHLSSLAITISRPLSFNWLTYFNSLKSLSLNFANPNFETVPPNPQNPPFDSDLNLESLSLRGILPGDLGLSYLWKNCKNIKRLRFKNCQSIGDYSSFSDFLKFSRTSLQELELRTCRNIMDLVLLTVASNCVSVNSLLIYDGGSKEGLLQFINQNKSPLTKLDLRLPLDLHNSHFLALSKNPIFSGLTSLRLESCCLVSGEGIKALGESLCNGRIEELALVNCDLVDREPGLLTDLGQSFKGLRKLDLSYNDMLVDKELVSMLASCSELVELKVRGCGMLTDVAVCSIVRGCKEVECVDVVDCGRVGVDAVEFLVVSCRRLRRVEVEGSKVSEVARGWASDKFIEVVS